MRWGALAVVACVLLAGCAAPFAAPSDGDNGTGSGAADGTAASSGGDGAAGASVTTGTPGSTSTPVTHEERPDPDADVLGWENGYWHDDPVPVDASDGLNESEREAVVARAMARVEIVRNLKFERPVNLTVRTRAGTSDEFTSGKTSEALDRFDNAKFEALFLIGSDNDAVGVQDANRNRTVAGFYSPTREAIVLVSDSSTPRLDGERTLAHELVHALQDQHFDISLAETPRTRDAYNGRNGLIEGDASAVGAAYVDRCGETWACLSSTAGGSESGSESGSDSGGSSVHLGVYVISFFPYSDGPAFVESLRDGDDWSDVNDAYAAPPRSSAEVIFPETYGTFERADVGLRDRTADGWERVRPAGRPDYGVLGPSALSAMFAYTLYDEYNASAVVESEAFLNRDGSGIDADDPFEYALDPVRGWQGDRLHVYERDGQTGYVWRLVWESPAAAERFVEYYRALVAHWGGDAVREDVYVIEANSPFAGAVAIDVAGDTVTVVGAPDREALGQLRRGAG
ncbi:MAG: hypothetical protein BRD23_00940 [Halobacteriales archaeon SW_9_67_25]|nr:MAG: hypothetical protein BRD23_00940 [Halobacteriales archaeon SW_9_67_25]